MDIKPLIWSVPAIDDFVVFVDKNQRFFQPQKPHPNKFDDTLKHEMR
jgi:hypothetical protein